MAQSIKTTTIKANEIKHEWFLVDAADKKIGRLATIVAKLLAGKYDPKRTLADYLPPSTKVIVVNAARVDANEKKRADKKYTRYSGYPDGLTTVNLGKMLDTKPEEVIEHAVRGMLPKNRWARQAMANLAVYRGDSHPHTPEELKVIK